MGSCLFLSVMVMLKINDAFYNDVKDDCIIGKKRTVFPSIFTLNTEYFASRQQNVCGLFFLMLTRSLIPVGCPLTQFNPDTVHLKLESDLTGLKVQSHKTARLPPFRSQSQIPGCDLCF